MIIVDNGRANATIVAHPDSSEGFRTAAVQLQKYIERSTGATLPIEAAGSGNLIQVGEVDKLRSAGVAVDGLAAEGFIVHCAGEQLVLAGVDGEATQFAVYHFLETVCGMRWYFPNQLFEIVPRTDTIEVQALDERHEPDFHCRDVGTGHSPYCRWPDDPQIQLWARANKLGGATRYHRGEDPTKEAFGADHPEYFALRAGARDLDSPHPQLCTSNPEVVSAVAERIRKALDENPDYKGVYWSPEDNPGFCECDNCRALDTGDVYRPDQPPMSVLDPSSGTSMTDRVFTFANDLATELENTHPEKQVVVLAYWYYVKPPRKLRLHRNVVVWYTASCIGHWNEARRELDFDRLRRWIRAANGDPGRLMIYEYYINGAWPDMFRLATIPFT